MERTVMLAGINGDAIETEWEIAVGDFVVHLTPGKMSYQLTHVPSGYGIWAGRNKENGHVWGWRCAKDAAAFAEKLHASLVPGDLYQSKTGEWKVKRRAQTIVRRLYVELWKHRL